MKNLYQCSCNKIFSVEKDAIECENLHKEKLKDEQEIKELKEKLDALEKTFYKKYTPSEKVWRDLARKAQQVASTNSLSNFNGKYYVNGKEITKEDFEKELVNFWY